MTEHACVSPAVFAPGFPGEGNLAVAARLLGSLGLAARSIGTFRAVAGPLSTR